MSIICDFIIIAVMFLILYSQRKLRVIKTTFKTEQKYAYLFKKFQ